VVAFEPAARGHSARVIDAGRVDLARSPTYRACRERLDALEGHLAAPARRTA
jgi:hypothetical protein